MPNSPRVLLAFASDALAARVDATLREAWPEALPDRFCPRSAPAARFAADALVCELFAGWGEAVAAFRAASGDAPVFLVVDAADEAAALRALDDGVDDYVLADAAARLVPALRRAVASRRERAQLAERAARLDNIVRSGIVGLIVSEHGGSVLEANDAALAVLGHPREDLLAGRVDWLTVTPPEWRAASLAAREIAARDGSAPLFEKEYLRSDGTRVPVLVGLARHGNVYNTCIINLSAQREAERRSLEAARRYETLFSASPLPCWLFDAETLALVAVNAAATSLYGWTRDEMLRMTTRELVVKPTTRESPAGAVLSSGAVRVEQRHRRRVGGPVDVMVTQGRVGIDGRPHGLVIAQESVGARRRRGAAPPDAEGRGARPHLRPARARPRRRARRLRGLRGRAARRGGARLSGRRDRGGD